MNNIELLFKQLQQYIQQNERDHERICSRTDQIYQIVEVTSNKVMSHEKELSTIKETLEAISNQIKEVHEDNLKRNHLTSWVLKALGALSLVAGIIGAAIKFGWL